MLVGFDSEREDGRDAARQAMRTGHGRRRTSAARQAAADPACGAGPAALGPAAARPALIADPVFSAGVMLVMLGAITKSPGALPRLAPRRDGCAHAGFRLSALGHHGPARRPAGALRRAMGATLGEWSLVTLGSITALGPPC